MRVALRIQHLTRMLDIVTSLVAPLSVPYFSTLSHKLRDFRKRKKSQHKMCVWIFCTNFVCNFSHSKNNLARHFLEYENVFM